MALVIVVFLGEDRKEEVALDIVVGPGGLVEHALVKPFLSSLFVEVGTGSPQEEDGLAIVGGDVEDEVSAGISLHPDGGDIVGEYQFALNRHRLVQAFVVDTEEGVESTLGIGLIGDVEGGAHLLDGDGAFLRLRHKVIGRGRLIAVHAFHHLIALLLIDK